MVSFLPFNQPSSLLDGVRFGLDQWVSINRWGHGQCLETVGVVTWEGWVEEVCFWHVVGRGQARWETANSTQASPPHNREFKSWNIKGALMEKHWHKSQPSRGGIYPQILLQRNLGLFELTVTRSLFSHVIQCSCHWSLSVSHSSQEIAIMS